MDFLASVYPRLKKYARFWDENRYDADHQLYHWADDAEPDIHQVESGWDNSPRWDKGCKVLLAIDLNCHLVVQRRALARIAEALGKKREADRWTARAAELAERVGVAAEASPRELAGTEDREASAQSVDGQEDHCHAAGVWGLPLHPPERMVVVYWRTKEEEQMTKYISLLVMAVIVVTDIYGGERVIAYRNGGSGAYPDADPPLEWSVHKNVKWHWQPECPMLETTISTPIIVGDRVFTLARPMTLVCIDKNTGEELWRREKHIDGGEDDDEDVRRVHEAIVRDCRINDLQYMLKIKGGHLAWSMAS